MALHLAGFDLLILDCDGVLVDSEVIAAEVEAQAYRAVGFATTPHEMAARFAGLTGREIMAAVEQELGRPLPPDFHQHTEAEIDRRLAAEVQPIAGAVPFVHALTHPACVCSNSSPGRVEVSLRRIGLWETLAGHVFSAAEVARPKPAPDVFLHAAARMNASPERCLVIEDSAAGVSGAVAAGMAVIGFTGGAHITPGHDARLRQAGAMAVTPNYAALAASLGLAEAGR